MKKSKNPVYIRYEFTDEAGRPEGGDILQYGSTAPVFELAQEILKIAHGDGVTVNITVGQEKSFLSFLKNVGMDKKSIESEMLRKEDGPAPASTKKKKPSKKVRRK